MLQLTMAGEYSVRAMLHLAAQPRGRIVPTNEISEAWEIPKAFLRKIVQLLSKSGLILSHRGVGGGLELAKPAEEITLLEVVEASEGKLALNKCLLHAGLCTRDSWCAVLPVWAEAQEKVAETLRGKTLAELARQSCAQREASTCSYPVYPHPYKIRPH